MLGIDGREAGEYLQLICDREQVIIGGCGAGVVLSLASRWPGLVVASV